jgi:hypothetical protein
MKALYEDCVSEYVLEISTCIPSFHLAVYFLICPELDALYFHGNFSETFSSNALLFVEGLI